MALPSSPPLIPQFLPPSSPPLPAASVLIQRHGLGSRKRQFSEDDGPSSDPIFSDYTTDGDDANSTGQGRRKRLVRGPWWTLGKGQNTAITSKADGANASRNVDSGVWMWSDASDGSAMEMPCILRSRSPSETNLSPDPPAVFECSADAALKNANRFVQACVDSGQERIDLTDIHLGCLDSSTLSQILKPLHQLLRQSHNHLTRPPSEDIFVPLTPRLQLFLSGNQLSQLPDELFRLKNMAVLSLRNNELVSIPHTIRHLGKLEELNISGNRLRHLPWQLLELLQRRHGYLRLTVDQNSLLSAMAGFCPEGLDDNRRYSYAQENAHDPSIDAMTIYQRCREWGYRKLPSQDDIPISIELQLRYETARAMRIRHQAKAESKEATSNMELMYLISTQIRYFDAFGSLCANPRKPFAHSEGVCTDPWRLRYNGYEKCPFDDMASQNPLPNPPPSTTAGRHVPSLFELSLRAVQAHYELPSNSSSDPPLADDLSYPPAIARAFSIASSSPEPELCSSCSRPFTIARASWIEWWHYSPQPAPRFLNLLALPFERRVCSWGCATPTEIGTFRT